VQEIKNTLNIILEIVFADASHHKVSLNGKGEAPSLLAMTISIKVSKIH